MPANTPKPRHTTAPSASRRAARTGPERDRRPTATRSIVIVLSTVPKAAATRIATSLVRARFAACVNVVPGVKSTYRWKARVERANEVLLVIKTTVRRSRALRLELARLHPYEIPEIVAIRASDVAKSYARWVDASTA